MVPFVVMVAVAAAAAAAVVMAITSSECTLGSGLLVPCGHSQFGDAYARVCLNRCMLQSPFELVGKYLP